MICPECGYNMVPDKSAYWYGCIVCETVVEEEEATEEEAEEK